MYRIGLNTALRDNYAFFCPDTRLYLTLTNPVGTTDRVSPAIKRGVKGKTLIDMDGLLKATAAEAPKQPVQDKKNDQPTQEPEQHQEPVSKEITQEVTQEPAPEIPEQTVQEQEIPEQPIQETEAPEQQPTQEPESVEEQPQETEAPVADVFSQLEGAAAPADEEKKEEKKAATKKGTSKKAKAAE